MAAPRQFRIGFLVDNLTSEYPAELAAGVLRAAREANAKLVIVAGGELGTAARPMVRNFVYDWLPSAGLDGLVIAAGSLSNHSGVSYLRDWLTTRFGQTPSVAIGLPLGDLPSVHVDNEGGMYALVKHLIESHGRRHIAFIGGPESSAEAQARQRGYQRALIDHGMRMDAKLLVRAPTLGREDGASAVAELCEARGLSSKALDAIVSMNDEMALGALEALNRRGISVPNSIAIAGFDDSAEAHTTNPPLSTVNQRIELQGYTGTRALLEALQNGRRPQGAQLQAEPIIRASCGCTQPLSNSSTATLPNIRLAKSVKLALLARRHLILAELVQAAGGRLAALQTWDTRLFDALLKSLELGPVTFLTELDQLFRRHMLTGHNTVGFHDVLTALRLQVLMCVALEPESRPKLEDLFQEARLLLSRIGSEVERTRSQNASMHLRVLWRSCLSQLGSRNPLELAPILDQHVPGLGVSAYCVSRLHEAAPAGCELEVVWRRSPGGASAAQTLRKADLGIDAGLEAEPVLVVKPLEFDDRPQGLAVFTWGALEPAHYAQLREMLGAALSGFGNAGRR